MNQKPTTDERRRATRYYHNLLPFLKDGLCKEDIDHSDFIPGTQRIEFYGERLRAEHFVEIIEPDLTGGTSYEEAILSRILQRADFSTLVLLGGLGAGKTTAITEVRRLLYEQREKLRITRCAQKCVRCPRKPLHINCIGIKRDSTPTEAILWVTQKIRRAVFDDMVREWLELHGAAIEVLSDPKTAQLLRYLIIANDLAAWAYQNRPELLTCLRPPKDLQTDSPILGLDPKGSTIDDLTERFTDHLAQLDVSLARIHHHRRDNIEYTSGLLSFFLSKCPAQNPQNILIVDNLDALPTRHIEDVAKAVHEIASANPYYQVILPLRPSSVFPAGFIRNMEIWYHYGPDCFQMVRHRILRYVLARSREELRGNQPVPPGGPPRTFVSSPSEEEINFLLVASYLYYTLMTVGAARSPDAVAQRALAVSSDHQFLERIKLPERSAKNIAGTVGALVGTCARYGNEQLLRYYRNMYAHPSAVFGALARVGPAGAATLLRVPYKLLVDTVVFDTAGGSVVERVANLYLPTRRTAAEHLPSLVKIRILHYLQQWKRASVGEVVREMDGYGVPADITIESLNLLHSKERLLLWFSENHELSSYTDDAGQYVVISEHGLSYLEHVLGDFEYMWACAAQIGGHDFRGSAFPVRLQEYLNLVSGVGETEWKQLAYRRLLASYVKTGRTRSEHGELLTLRILYSSLARAMSSAVPILRRAGFDSRERRQVTRETTELVESLCRAILVWQDKYRIAFGSRGFLERYAASLAEARQTLGSVREAVKLPREADEVVQDVLDSWRPDEGAAPAGVTTPRGPLDMSEDIITGLAKYLRAFLPFPKEWLRSADDNIALKIHMARFQESEAWLGFLLAETLPSYREVQDGLRQLERNILPLIELGEAIGPATGTDFFKRVLAERDWIREYLERLERNEIAVSEPCGLQEMTKRKKRFNNLMAILQDVGNRYSDRSLSHLEIAWH